MTYRQNYTLALLGLDNADLATITRGFLRTLAHANKQLIGGWK
jgi:hypothetical protein